MNRARFPGKDKSTNCDLLSKTSMVSKLISRKTKHKLHTLSGNVREMCVPN